MRGLAAITLSRVSCGACRRPAGWPGWPGTGGAPGLRLRLRLRLRRRRSLGPAPVRSLLRLLLLLLLLPLLLHLRHAEEILPRDQHDRRQHDRQDGVLLIVHCLSLVGWTARSAAGALERRGLCVDADQRLFDVADQAREIGWVKAARRPTTT